MRLAIISDVHGDIEALEYTWSDIQSQSVEAVFCLGDLVGYRTAPNEVIEFIRRHQVSTVMGDFDEFVGFELSARDHYHHDPQKELLGQQSLRKNKQSTSADNKRFLRSLPLQIRQQIDGVKVLMVHGSPRQINEYVYDHKPQATFEELAKFAGSDVVFFGHTGLAYTKKVSGTWFVNAGSVGGIPAEQSYATYWLINLAGSPEFTLRRVNRPKTVSVPRGWPPGEFLETNKAGSNEGLQRKTLMAADIESGDSAH